MMRKVLILAAVATDAVLMRRLTRARIRREREGRS